jgi:hypothetical protein
VLVTGISKAAIQALKETSLVMERVKSNLLQVLRYLLLIGKQLLGWATHSTLLLSTTTYERAT